MSCSTISCVSCSRWWTGTFAPSCALQPDFQHLRTRNFLSCSPPSFDEQQLLRKESKDSEPKDSCRTASMINPCRFWCPASQRQSQLAKHSLFLPARRSTQVMLWDVAGTGSAAGHTMDSLHLSRLMKMCPAASKAEAALSPAPSFLMDQGGTEGSTMGTESGSLATWDSAASFTWPAEQELEADSSQQQMASCKGKPTCRYSPHHQGAKAQVLRPQHLRGPIQLLPGYPSPLPHGQVWGVPLHIPFLPAPSSAQQPAEELQRQACHAQGGVRPERAHMNGWGVRRSSDGGQAGLSCVSRTDQGACFAGSKSVHWSVQSASGRQAGQHRRCSSSGSGYVGQEGQVHWESGRQAGQHRHCSSISSGNTGQEGQAQGGKDGAEGADRCGEQGQKQEAGGEGVRGQHSAGSGEGCSTPNKNQQHCSQQWEGKHKHQEQHQPWQQQQQQQRDHHQQQQQQQQQGPHSTFDGLQQLHSGMPAAVTPPLLPQHPHHSHLRTNSNSISVHAAAPSSLLPQHSPHSHSRTNSSSSSSVPAAAPSPLYPQHHDHSHSRTNSNSSCVRAAAPPSVLPEHPHSLVQTSIGSTSSSQGGAAAWGGCIPPHHNHQQQQQQQHQQQPRHHHRGKHRRGARSHIPQQLLLGSSPPEAALQQQQQQQQLQQRRSHPFPLSPTLSLSAPAFQTPPPLHLPLELPHSPGPFFETPRLSRIRFISGSRVSSPLPGTPPRPGTQAPPPTPTLNPTTYTSSRVIGPANLPTSLSTGNLTHLCRPPLPVSRCTPPMSLHPQQQLLPMSHSLPGAGGGGYSSSTTSMFPVRHPGSMPQAGSSQAQHCHHHYHHHHHHHHQRRYSSSSCVSGTSSISSWPSQSRSQSQSLSAPSWNLQAPGATNASSTPSSSSSSRAGGPEEDSSVSSLLVKELPPSRAACAPAMPPPNLVVTSPCGSQTMPSVPSMPSTPSTAGPVPVRASSQRHRAGDGVASAGPH